MQTLSGRHRSLVLRGMSLLAGLGLLTPIAAFAQVDQRAAGIAMLGAFMMVFLVIFAAFYIYSALALQTIAKKTGTENGWLAWIPIANIILMLTIAKKPLWWFILCFVPIVNLVILIIVWMAIAEARGKPNWWGILLIVPVVNLIVPGYLAWSD